MRVPLREEKRIQITKIRDSEAGGLPSVKNEDFFHGFMPREQVRGSNAGGGGHREGEGYPSGYDFSCSFLLTIVLYSDGI